MILDAMKIDDDDVDKITEEVYKRDNFDKQFDIGICLNVNTMKTLEKKKKK